MASILRSSKFIRIIAGFAHNIPLNRSREIENNFFQNTSCLCNLLNRTLTSQIASQHIPTEQSLERSLRRLDQDVRRSGRISRRDIEDILEEIKHTRTASSSQSLLVIRCCGNLVPEELPDVRTKLVQEIWETLIKLNIPMDISHYNALLRVYLENEYSFSPTEFLQILEAKGIEPNRVTYQRLIARYCQEGDIEGATRILEFMREKQLPVNENVFNALIMGHSRADDMDSAKSILTVMQQAGLHPSADTYTTLLCGYAQKGDVNAIENILMECNSNNIFLLDKDYLDIIYILAINNHEEYIPKLLDKIRKSFGYNQDAVNLILKLVNHEKEDVALKILKTMSRVNKSDGQIIPTGTFFIKQLVKTKRPVNTILSMCQYLVDEGLNEKAYSIAADIAIQEANSEIIYPVLLKLKADGFPLRQHYFWPLIIASGAKKDDKEILNILRKMISEFNLMVTGETLRDYVIPNLNFKDVDKLIAALNNVSISTGSAASSCVYDLLSKNDLKTAADVCKRYNAYYSPVLLKRHLTSAFLKTNDLESYILVVRQIHDNLKRNENNNSKEEDNLNDINSEFSSFRNEAAHIIGQLVMEIAIKSRNKVIENVTYVLNGFVEHGFTISNVMAERLQEHLGEQLTPEISTLLGKLTSGELILKTLEKTPSTTLPRDILQLERMIKNFKGKEETLKSLNRQLLALYCRSRDLEKVETLLKENENFDWTSGMYAQLIELYVHHEHLEKAKEYYEKLKIINNNAALDDSKVIKFVSLLIKNDYFNDAISFLNEQSRERKLEEHSFSYTTICWRLLMSLADQGKETELKILFDTLLKNEYISISNVMLGPLVKVHIINNNLNKAMEQFEWCCKEYRMTPWKNELACKLIQNEDAINLQKLTDLSTTVHGEVNSLYDLVFAFVECGRIRQARKILETPGLRSRQQRVNIVCERYSQEGQIKSLEGLIEATKDLNYFDRSDIFYHLLNSYIKNDDSEKAIGLWTRMQEENIPSSDDFLRKLGFYLKSVGKNVPFIIPNKIGDNISNEETHLSSEKTVDNKIIKMTNTQMVSDDLKNFRQAIKVGNIDKAIEVKNNLTTSTLTVMDHSFLIEALIKSERLNEAKKEIINMLEMNTHPLPRIFRFFLNKLALVGDVETIQNVGSRLNPEIKKIISYDNRLCHANIIAGKSKDYLEHLNKDIDNAKDEELKQLADKFPRGGIIGILETHPELIEDFEKIAIKYAKRGIMAPINVLWMKYFISDENTKAQVIWNDFLAKSPRLMFQRIVQHARDNKDENLIWKLINLLKATKVTEGAIGNAYSCLLDIIVAKNNYEESLETLNKALEDVCLENINRTALLRIKEGVEKNGKPFPFIIPSKNAKFNSSASSSDEEKFKS